MEWCQATPRATGNPTSIELVCRHRDLADPELVADRAFRNLAGYGPLEPLLADDDVWEIIVTKLRTCDDAQKTMY